MKPVLRMMPDIVASHDRSTFFLALIVDAEADMSSPPRCMTMCAPSVQPGKSVRSAHLDRDTPSYVRNG